MHLKNLTEQDFNDSEDDRDCIVESGDSDSSSDESVEDRCS